MAGLKFAKGLRTQLIDSLSNRLGPNVSGKQLEGIADSVKKYASANNLTKKQFNEYVASSINDLNSNSFSDRLVDFDSKGFLGKTEQNGQWLKFAKGTSKAASQQTLTPVEIKQAVEKGKTSQELGVTSEDFQKRYKRDYGAVNSAIDDETIKQQNLNAAIEKGRQLREETQRYQNVHKNDYSSNRSIDDVKIQEKADIQSAAAQRSKDGGKVRSKKIAKRTDEIMRANDDIERAQAVELAKQSLYGPHKPISVPVNNTSSQKAQQVATQAGNTTTINSMQDLTDANAALIEKAMGGGKAIPISGGSSNSGKISGRYNPIDSFSYGGKKSWAKGYRKARQQYEDVLTNGSDEEKSKILGLVNTEKFTPEQLADAKFMAKTIAKDQFKGGPSFGDYVVGNPKTLTAATGVAVGFGAIATVSSNGGRRSNSSLYGSPF